MFEKSIRGISTDVCFFPSVSHHEQKAPTNIVLEYMGVVYAEALGRISNVYRIKII